jgi:hypothetical protein
VVTVCDAKPNNKQRGKESAMPQNVQEVHPLLRSPWGWNWPKPGDPGPDWNLIVSRLDKVAIVKLAEAQLSVATKELEAQKTVLDAQLKALGTMQEIIRAGVAK